MRARAASTSALAGGLRGSVGDGEGVGRTRIGKEQDGEIEASLVAPGGERRPDRGRAAASGAGLDDVGVRGLAGGLALLGEGAEAGGFGDGALGYGELAVRGERGIEESDNGGVEAAAGDLEFRGGDGERGRGAG